MNQFKKAKMKLIEQGQEVEQITDLKTAGVKENKQAFETSKESLEAKSEIIETKIKEKEEKTEEIVVEVEEVIKEKTKSTNDNSQISTTIDEEKQKNTVKQQNDEIPIAVSVSKIEQKESIVSDQTQTIESDTTPVKKIEFENQILETKAINLPNTIYEKNLTGTISQTQAQPIIEQPKIEPQKVIEQPEIVIVQQQPKITQPIVNSQPAKKTIPNIFSPKEEPKSMRKSLVLKPTSVKKAESYCNKNGGSFNELIQTLLDNFINEYEL